MSVRDRVFKRDFSLNDNVGEHLNGKKREDKNTFIRLLQIRVFYLANKQNFRGKDLDAKFGRQKLILY